MRLMLHIFRKDARRLWREIVMTVALLSALASLDSSRSDASPGQIEIALNALIPFVWAFLAALLIHGEPLVGDRQFWITRPYPWRTLLASKALFALAFIHVPSLLTNLAVVALRGFNPLDSLPPLLWKQLLLAVVVTLPAAALAAITANLPQFIMAELAIVVAVLVLWAELEPASYPWVPLDWARRAMAWLPLMVTSVAVVWSQYSRRRTVAAWVALSGAVLISAAAYGYLPRELTFAVQCALSRQNAASEVVSLVLNSAGSPKIASHWMPPPPGMIAVAIPIRVSGLERETRFVLNQLALEVRSAAGETWRAAIPPGKILHLRAVLWMNGGNLGWQIITLDRPFYERIQSRETTVAGRAALVAFREDGPVRMPALAAGTRIAHIGRCSSFVVDDILPRQALKVLCESPGSARPSIQARLTDPATGNVWNQRMDRDIPGVIPLPDWFSPIHRWQEFFYLVSDPMLSGTWQAPETILPRAQITLTPERQTVSMILHYELQNLDLRRYLADPF